MKRPVPYRTLNVYDADGAARYRDRATVVVFGNTAAVPPLAIGPNVIANFFVAMESATDQLFDGDSAGGLIGLTLDDLSADTRFGLQLFRPGETGIFEVRGDVDHLSITAVPAPAGIILFGSALGFLGWKKRQAA